MRLTSFARLGMVLTWLACAPAKPMLAPTASPGSSAESASVHLSGPEPEPLLPPKEAWARGWMPLKSTAVDEFLKAHPNYDGRGVLVGILDSGIDPSIPGLVTTSSGQRKVLDLRDFSGEGAVPLSRLEIKGDQVTVAGRTLSGVSRLRVLAVGGAVYGGGVAEVPLGEMPAADLNGNGNDMDTLAIVVVRASDGWVLFADTDGDGSLLNEKPVHDYLVTKDTFGWHTGKQAPALTVAANFDEVDGEPRLDLLFDTSAHGSHVAGIAAAHDMYGVVGFNGVAPGAYLLGLKIANNAQGGISTSGSMVAALKYAIRFARDRKLPLVLNMSFGVGNETEGRARIDAVVDSILTANPEVVFTISAGNDGPGLSTVGFPGSATRAITVGATFPGVFLGASGKGGDPVAYFSSRGGELAKPDIVTPGLAYSTVPRWNIGDERKGGTSMASPHAAGLAALLVSGLRQERRQVDARQIRQALMVTARPLATGTYLDDGTGQPDVAAAWRWLARAKPMPEITVRALGNGLTAAFQERRLGASSDSVQSFEVSLPSGAAETEVSLRSTMPWLRAPAKSQLRAGANTVSLTYQTSALGRPGVYTGVVTGWTPDTLAGPVFRLVNTVVVADTGGVILAKIGAIPAGGDGRLFFQAQAGRPFAVTFATQTAGEQVLAYLHEPGGQPYRDENGIGAGYGDDAAVYLVDGRDVVAGLYEAVAVAPPLDGASATIAVQQSPVTIEAKRDREGLIVQLGNVSPAAVSTSPFVALVGAERATTLVERGSETQHIRFQIPEWAVHAAVDVQMDRVEWPTFTDFGVTLIGEDGRQLGKAPLNYSFGRLQADLPKRTGSSGAEVTLFPGFAEAGADQRWTATVSIRLYADSAHVFRTAGKPVTVEPGKTATVLIPMLESQLKLGDAFVPLGIVVVPEADRTWTRAVALPPPVTPLSQ